MLTATQADKRVAFLEYGELQGNTTAGEASTGRAISGCGGRVRESGFRWLHD